MSIKFLFRFFIVLFPSISRPTVFSSICLSATFLSLHRQAWIVWKRLLRRMIRYLWTLDWSPAVPQSPRQNSSSKYQGDSKRLRLSPATAMEKVKCKVSNCTTANRTIRHVNILEPITLPVAIINWTAIMIELFWGESHWHFEKKITNMFP